MRYSISQTVSSVLSTIRVSVLALSVVGGLVYVQEAHAAKSSTSPSSGIAVQPRQTTASQSLLPACTLDSFVSNAGGQAEDIYGDEGVYSPPPYYGFDYSHRINSGITGQTDAGLTTGHGSYMPSAWGADEFLAPPGEQSQSGTNGGNPRLNNADAALNAQDQLESINLGSSSNPSANYGPSPGPGWYPVVGCGGTFLGWMPPAQAAAWANGDNSALAAFFAGPNYIGDPLEAAYEIAQINASLGQ